MNSSIITSSIAIDILRTMADRRAVRKYKETPVNRALIDKVIDAGRMAPSAMNNQPWHFYVLTTRDMISDFSKEISRTVLKGVVKLDLQEMAKAAAGLLHFISHGNWDKLKDPVFHGAPVVIFLAAPINSEWASLDIGMCAQNMMLAAKALGLDTCPIGFAKYVRHTKSYPMLHIPSDEEVLLAITLGYGDETPVKHEQKKGNVLFIK